MAYLSRFLVSHLKRNKSREIIESVRASLLYLPPYSPDLNPIENMWSKRRIKAWTIPELEAAIPCAFSFIEASDAEGWFSHANYVCG
jgi:transposase